MENGLELERLTERIIGAAIEVHRRTGPGLLESSYEECLCAEFRHLGLAYERQVPLPIVYRDVKLDAGYRMDVVVEAAVVIEIKAVEKTLPVHQAQLLTYLRLSGKRVGLLINFCVPVLKDGIIRRVL